MFSDQNFDIFSRADCKKGLNITFLQGLTFQVYCDADLYGNDLSNAPADSAAECLDGCKKSYGCFGVTWVPDARVCYRKTFQTSKDDIKQKAGLISILPNMSQLNKTADETTCPFPNLSQQTVKQGLNFKVLCGAILWGDDIYDYTKQPDNKWMRAENLTQCMEHCADHQPLCSRVTFDAERNLNLWLNCWLKTASQVKPQVATGGLRHSAIAMFPEIAKVDCKNNTQYVSTKGTKFKMSCMDYRVLNDTTAPPISRTHQDNIDACLDSCTQPKTNCTSIAFDAGLQEGYKNCYQFSSMPPPHRQHGNYTFMYLETLSSQYRAPASEPKDGLSKSDIAALATVPALGILLAFAVYWFWYREPRKERKYAPVKSD